MKNSAGLGNKYLASPAGDAQAAQGLKIPAGICLPEGSFVSSKVSAAPTPWYGLLYPFAKQSFGVG